MASVNVRTTLDRKKLADILKHAGVNAEEGVKTLAFAVEAKAKPKAPVDTGALQSSIYVRMNKHNGYGKASAEARQRREEAELVELPEPDNALTAIVGPCVSYGAAVELGSANRAGRPYLGPAVKEVEREMASYFTKVATD